jgi:hypothetical protein
LGDRIFGISTIGYGLANLPAGFDQGKHLCRGVSIELWRGNDGLTLETQVIETF